MGKGMVGWSEFSVEVSGQPLTCLVAEPKELSDCPAMLLNFAADRTTTLKSEPYSITPRMFLAAGHRALSFDLPCHGDREVPGQPRGIAGFCAEWRRRVDVFAGFVDEGRAVIDTLIERKLAEPGRIFVSGASRGGYCALRLMAADERIGAAAAFSPVTDWRVLKEFAEIRDTPEIAELALPDLPVHWQDALSGRQSATATRGLERMHVSALRKPCCEWKLRREFRRRGLCCMSFRRGSTSCPSIGGGVAGSICWIGRMSNDQLTEQGRR